MKRFAEWLKLREMWGTQAEFVPNTKTLPGLYKGCAGGPGECPKGGGGAPMPMAGPAKKSKKK